MHGIVTQTETAVKENGTHLFLSKEVSVSLTIIALVLWSFSILQSKLIIGYYGLFESLPILYFVALGSLTIASAILWISKENHGKLLFFQLCFLITALWLTPLLLGSNAAFASTVYRDFAFVNYINQFNQLNPAQLTYHSWPGLWLIEALLTKITGTEIVDAEALLGALIMQFLILIPLYLLLHNTIKRTNFRWAAAWIFYLGNWTGQVYISPQGMGIFFWLIILALLTKSFARGNAGILVSRIFTLLIMLATIVSHFLTSVVASLSTALLWATQRIKDMNINLILLGIILIVGWTLYGAASTQLGWALSGFVQRAFNLDFLFEQHFSDVLQSGSESHNIVREVWIWYSVLLIGIAVSGLILSIKFKNNADRIMLALATIPIFIVFSFIYPAEFFMRASLYGLVPIGYFGTKLLNLKATSIILCFLLLVSIPLSIIALYGNAANDRLPRGEIAYWHFVQDNISKSYLTGGLSPTLMGYAGYDSISFSELEWENGQFVGTALGYDRPHYVNVGKYDQSKYTFAYNQPEFIPDVLNRLDNSIYYNLIYVNNDTNLFIHEDSKK